MQLATERYVEQVKHWPKEGRHILAHFDADSIVVYQAYRPAIGRHAVEHCAFGGEFSYTRMSWVKPNFLWMMFRCGWGTKPDQEMTLALRLRRTFFEEILAASVQSTYFEGHHASRGDWEAAKARSDVRLQWDPDHGPTGAKLDRRAVQLGLRGATLRAFGQRELLEVIDLTDFVAEQRPLAQVRGWPDLLTPVERVYRPADPAVYQWLGLADTPPDG